MNCRSFIQALGLSAAAVALSPMLDFTPIVAAPSIPVPSPGPQFDWITVPIEMFCPASEALRVL